MPVRVSGMKENEVIMDIQSAAYCLSHVAEYQLISETGKVKTESEHRNGPVTYFKGPELQFSKVSSYNYHKECLPLSRAVALKCKSIVPYARPKAKSKNSLTS